MLQYCQLDEIFRDISRLIANVLLLNFKISVFSTIPRGNMAWNYQTRLWAGRSGVPIPARARGFSLLESIQTRHGATQPPLQWILEVFPRVKRPGRQVPRLRMSGAVPLLLRCEDRNRYTLCHHEYVWRCGFVAVRTLVEVSGQPYSPAALVPGKDTLVPPEQEGKRIPEPVRTL